MSRLPGALSFLLVAGPAEAVRLLLVEPVFGAGGSPATPTAFVLSKAVDVRGAFEWDLGSLRNPGSQPHLEYGGMVGRHGIGSHGGRE